jgi:S1-C subfamily serine protease
VELKSLAEHWMFSTVRIKASGEGSDGSRFESVGTGFVFGYSLEHVQQMKEGRWSFFMVTNKHVVEGADKGTFTFIEAEEDGSPRLGYGVKIPIDDFEQHWHGHPDDDVDIAVMPIQSLINEMNQNRVNTCVAPVLRGHVPPLEKVAEMDVVEEILFIGYPDGRYDRHNLTPIIRRGTTATPLQLDYGGDPTFLVDASVFPGSSGSPVFIADIATYKERTGKVRIGGRRAWFLGVVSSVFYRWADGKIDIDEIPAARRLKVESEEMLDLGVAHKSSTVLETIEDFFGTYPA